jgi:hypothetical protein
MRKIENKKMILLRFFIEEEPFLKLMIDVDISSHDDRYYRR